MHSLKHLIPKFIAPGEGHLLTVTGGDQTTSKLTSTDTGDRLSLAEYTVIPNAGPPLHVHEREDEVFWILEGEVTFWVNNHRIVAKPGACIFAARGVPHTFKNCSTTNAKMILIVTPAANFETFFSGISRPDAQGKPPSEEVVMARVMAEAPRHGLTILGPSPL